MKSLREFQSFDANAFFREKTLKVTSVSPWQDYATKDTLGTKVEVVITEDNTQYRQREGYPPVNNLYEKFSIKVPKDSVDVQIGDTVVMIDPVATIYGDYQHLLSVKASDVVAVS